MASAPVSPAHSPAHSIVFAVPASPPPAASASSSSSSSIAGTPARGMGLSLVPAMPNVPMRPAVNRALTGGAGMTLNFTEDSAGGAGTLLNFMETSCVTGGGGSGGGGGGTAESLLASHAPSPAPAPSPAHAPSPAPASCSSTGGGMHPAPGAPKASRKLQFSMSRGGGGAGGGSLFPEDMATHDGNMLRITRLGDQNKYLQRELGAKDKQIIQLKLQVRLLQAAAKEQKDKIGAMLEGVKAFKQIEAEAEVVEVDDDDEEDEEDEEDEDEIEDEDDEEEQDDEVGGGVKRQLAAEAGGQQTKRARSTGESEQDEIKFQAWVRHASKVQLEEAERKAKQISSWMRQQEEAERKAKLAESSSSSSSSSSFS